MTKKLDTSPTPDLGVFSIKEFAAMFRLSRGMVYKLKLDKKVRFTKIGTRSVITMAEARRFQKVLESDAA
jgi:hypothetical protein